MVARRSEWYRLSSHKFKKHATAILLKCVLTKIYFVKMCIGAVVVRDNFLMNCPVVACSDVIDFSLLKQHLTVNHGFPVCGVCKRELQYMKSYVRHVNQCVQTKDLLKPCLWDDCTEMISVFNKEKHYRTSHGYPNCTVCLKPITGVHNWRAHVNQCAPIPCPLDDCDETMTVLNRAEHCTRIHAYPKCKICPTEVEGLDNWVKHVNRCIRIHDTTSMRCPLDGCDAQLTSLTRQEHYKIHHFAPFCPTCPAKIDVVNNWLKHIDSCNNRSFQSVRCTLCPSDDERILTHLFDQHVTNVHNYPRCAVDTCSETFTMHINHARHSLACRRKPQHPCPYQFSGCNFHGLVEAMLHHLDRVHSEHLSESVRADKLRSALNCAYCNTVFGNLYVFGKHVLKCSRKRYECKPCGLVWSQKRFKVAHVCGKHEALTLADFLLKCQRPFYTMIKGASTDNRITYAAEFVLNQLALSDSFVPMIAASSGPFASLFIANVAFESPALSLLPVDDLSRTRLAVYMAYRPAEYIWLLLVSELQTKTRNSDEFRETLKTAVIPPDLVPYFSEEKLRDPNFLREERIHAYDMEVKHGQSLVYEAADGELPLNDLMINIGYAAGKCSPPGRVFLHSGLVPTTDRTNMHAVMRTRSALNIAREAAQTSAAYEFFKSFGALWYATFKCFFIRHNDDEGARVPKVSTKWTLDHMSRTFDAFEAIKVVNRENLPRDIECVGWVYPGKNGKTFAKELRDHSFMEMMWLELKRESAGYLYDRNTIVWLFCAPVVPAKPRDFSIQPACLLDDPRFVTPAEVSKKRKLLM